MSDPDKWLMEALLDRLPSTGEEFPMARRLAWLRAAMYCFELLYDLAPDDEGEVTIGVEGES